MISVERLLSTVEIDLAAGRAEEAGASLFGERTGSRESIGPLQDRRPQAQQSSPFLR